MATRRSGRSAAGLPSLPLWLAFFFFFPLLSLPLPFLFVKGGGRQRRAGVSGRGLEFHLNDCSIAHAAPRSRPACAPQPAPADGRPAEGRPRHRPETAGPDLGALGAAALAFPPPPRPSDPGRGEGRAVPGSREGEPPLPPPSLEEVCGSGALCPPRGAPQCQPRGPAQAAGRGCPSRADGEAASYMEFGLLRSPSGLVPRLRPWRSPPPPARRSGGRDATGRARDGRT